MPASASIIFSSIYLCLIRLLFDFSFLKRPQGPGHEKHYYNASCYAWPLGLDVFNYSFESRRVLITRLLNAIRQRFGMLFRYWRFFIEAQKCHLKLSLSSFTNYMRRYRFVSIASADKNAANIWIILILFLRNGELFVTYTYDDYAYYYAEHTYILMIMSYFECHADYARDFSTLSSYFLAMGAYMRKGPHVRFTVKIIVYFPQSRHQPTHGDRGNFSERHSQCQLPAQLRHMPLSYLGIDG